MSESPQTPPDQGPERSEAGNNPGHGKIDPELVCIEPHRGSRPGDRFARITQRRQFRRVGPGHFVAAPDADIPTGTTARRLRRLKQFFIGPPLLRAEEPKQRLNVFKALAIFGSDPISSSAYATEAALAILVVAGSRSLSISFYIALAVSAILIMVAFSYRQTIKAYPQGGGSYNVSKANLGQVPGLVAASALLIDYVLTVAVSIVAGVQAILSALIVTGFGPQINSFTASMPGFLNPTVLLSLLFIGLMVLANLRGVREAGTIFAVPTYLFIFGFLLMLVVGVFKAASGTLQAAVPPPVLPVTQTLTIWLVLRAFSAGAVAMTGTEAVSNGVPVFRPPETRNAANTLTIMALLLGTFYLGLSFLATHMGLVPGNQTIISQTALAVFGQNAIYYIFQIATMGILVVAGNTAFADFPRLASVLSRDGYMPHQFQFRGDRLAFSTGIIALGAVAAVLVVGFRGNVNSLINLYAIGVFLAFSFSETGMVVHWLRERGPHWRRSLVINGLAAVLTSTVLVIAILTKFIEGGWIVVALSPLIVVALLGIKRHYQHVGEQLSIMEGQLPPAKLEQLAILPIEDVNYASLRAMSFIRSIDAVRVVIHVSTDPERAERIRQRMAQYAPDLKLVVIESPTVSFVQPLISYVDAIHKQSPSALVSIVFPEFITAHWWERILHNRTAQRLYRAFETHPNVAIVLVPYLLEK